MPKNKLAKEASSYLQQHVDNPVDWYPWSEEALEKAKKENKPILLSIGYSACHWCHVMAHESFEDKETAELMNKLFINIKVDREERPDLDKVYQTAHQLLTNRSGGWPLTAFLTPDGQIPYFVGTYFPKEPRYQMPAFKDVLRYMAAIYQEKKEDIEKQNDSLLNALDQLSSIQIQSSATMDSAPLEQARGELAGQFDSVHGGFGKAPKFPMVKNLELLLHYWYESKKQDKTAFTMLDQSLEKMALGGIYDQIGGGFFRYSVDSEWQIPHFEKMLYDNALLLSLYAQTDAIEPKPLYKKILRETGEWVMQTMQAEEGNYYATLDADSEGQEGKFYAWSKEELQTCLTSNEYTFLEHHFNLNLPPNFEKYWHLNIKHFWDRESNTLWETIREKLHEKRNKRVKPHRDEKIITAWNGLMIKGMVLAGIQLKRKDFIDSGERALRFIHQKMWKNNRLLTSAKEEKFFPAYLDDYVFLLEATLILLQAKWKTEYLEFAQKLADNIINYFSDEKKGGFFFVAKDHEKLFYKPKPLSDEALPSSNAVAALVLSRLGLLLGETRYLVAAEKTIKMLWQLLQQYPSFHASTLLSLFEYLNLPEIIIVRGRESEVDLWKEKYFMNSYSPHRLFFAIASDISNLPPALAEKQSSCKITAYLCKGQSCSPPITNLREFENVISHNS